MKTFVLKFAGRQRGAIGAFYPIEITVEAANEEGAKEKLFAMHDKYEPHHIISIEEKIPLWSEYK